MKYSTQIINEQEQERIHKQSIRILEEVGVRFHGEKALDILAKHGAKVDWDSKIAKIPAALVEQALATSPKSFVLGSRNPQYDLAMPSPISYYCMDGTAAFALDFESGERRYGTRKDIRNAMRIFQQLDLGRMAWAPTTASDAPSPSRALHEFFEMVRNCSKHGQHELHTTSQVPYLIEGLTAIMGSEDELKRRNAFSLIYCPVAPLTHDGEMLDAYLELGQVNMPVMIMPMPVPGSTGPASLFGTLCLANAETLSSIVIYQLAHPGRPLVYSSAMGTLDFATGGYLGGTTEMGLQSAALSVMGRFYNLPCSCAGCTSDAMEAGPQAVMEKLITSLPPAMAGADIIVGFGEIQSDQLLVLEQMIVDNEIAHYCKRVVEGIDCSEEKALFDEIAQVGPGGHFLKTKGTRLAPRSGEFYASKLMDRTSYEAWTNLGKPTMYTRAKEQVHAILAGPVVDALPSEVEGRLEEILRRADEELKE
ncbi:MAG: hypothetical protein GYA34_12270 [Chloroflexi bacterium]|nr:hypothetical protein [Chloroflexota bacterium]